MDVDEEQKRLVLARLKTINPDAKIMLGTKKKVSVKELIFSAILLFITELFFPRDLI